MTEFVQITEVGLRDGLQNQPKPVNTDEKFELAQALIAANIRQIEVTSFVSPKAVPQMADAVEIMARMPRNPGMEYSVLVPNLKGYERARETKPSMLAVVVASTDTFNLRNINMTVEQAKNACKAVIEAAKVDGIPVRAYVSGALACPYEGKTPVHIVHALTEEMLAAGASEISIADTIGAGNPKQIEDIMLPLVKNYGADKFNLHLHDTRGMALAMAWAGIQCGVRKFDASVGGLGGCPFAPGASGNVSTEDLVYMLHEAGFSTGIDFAALCSAVEVAEKVTARELGGHIMRWVKSQQQKKCDGLPVK